MPRNPMNYDETYFYKVVCRDLNIKDVYVGHTTDFKTRKCKHKSACCSQIDSNKHNLYVYTFIRANGGWENFDMILIEKHKCEDRLHAFKKEREYIESLNATLNQKIPTRTKKEWKDDNKERVKECGINWRKENQPRIQEQKKEYFTQNKEYYLEQSRTRYKDKKN
jgi:hypothetical protein